MNDTNIKYLKLAIENSKRSMEEGNFPAGAVVVKDDKVIALEVSSPYPSLFHADYKAVAEAFKKFGLLTGATLYVGLQPCLMCTGAIYWSGLRRVVYAVPKSKVSNSYYETPKDTFELFNTFNEKIEFIHIQELESETLKIMKDWEDKILRRK